ncbi:MAG: sigma-70 family RNA polymerase sigma factor [Deltaproteobacteria bacterium]|nr:sigma-70 family RNA polymerase sigma factor [Deltaproteobacteria bacterium]
MTGRRASRKRLQKKAKRRPSRRKEIAWEQIAPLLPLIDRVIYTYFRWALPKINLGIYDIHDLQQEGTLGIIRAIQLFNPKKGKLANFARWHIRGRIGRFLRSNRFPNITIPTQPTLSLGFLPIDKPISKDLPLTPIDIISLDNYQATASEKEHQATTRQLAVLILQQIPRPQRTIVTKRFGICICKNNCPAHYHKPMSLQQIGKQKGVSREKIRQTLQTIFAKAKRSKNKTIDLIQQESKIPC